MKAEGTWHCEGAKRRLPFRPARMTRSYVGWACALAYSLWLTASSLNAQDSVTVLMNGTLHVGNGEVIENAAIAMQHGKILWTADARVIKLDMTNMRTIRCFGKHIYPAFIASVLTLVVVSLLGKAPDEAKWRPFIDSDA